MRDIGIIGTGLWQGEPINNDYFGDEYLKKSEVRDPFKGKRDDDGIVRIAGLELSASKHRRTLAAIERSFNDPYRGACRRRFFPRTLKVVDAETEAARAAISDAGLRPADVDAILVQSLLPDEILIKDATAIAHNLGIKRAPAWNVDSVCTSVLTQANLGAALISCGQARNVLCIQSVAYSRVMDMSTSAAVVVGDMASAFLLGHMPGGQLEFAWLTDGRLHNAIRYQWETPHSSNTRSYWEPSQERLTLHFDRDLQAAAMGELADYAITTCNQALHRSELRIEDLDLFVPHQPLSWFPALMEDILDLPDGISFHTFEEYGSINAASITASLHEARRKGRLKPGSRALVFVPGGGYLYGAMAMRW